MYRTQDLHVKEIVPLLSPRALKIKKQVKAKQAPAEAAAA